VVTNGPFGRGVMSDAGCIGLICISWAPLIAVWERADGLGATEWREGSLIGAVAIGVVGLLALVAYALLRHAPTARVLIALAALTSTALTARELTHGALGPRLIALPLVLVSTLAMLGCALRAGALVPTTPAIPNPPKNRRLSIGRGRSARNRPVLSWRIVLPLCGISIMIALLAMTSRQTLDPLWDGIHDGLAMLTWSVFGPVASRRPTSDYYLTGAAVATACCLPAATASILIAPTGAASGAWLILALLIVLVTALTWVDLCSLRGHMSTCPS